MGDSPHGYEVLERPRKMARITVYDAVAGRANYEGFLSAPKPKKYRDSTSTTIVPIPPDEVLFRSENAPVRYEENDIYSADRHLDQSKELQRLPDSDLLKTLHAYASDFYARVTGGSDDWESLDETALLALGVLVEEAAGNIGRQAAGLDLDEERDASTESSESTLDGDAKTESTDSPDTSQSTLRGDFKMEPND